MTRTDYWEEIFLQTSVTKVEDIVFSYYKEKPNILNLHILSDFPRQSSEQQPNYVYHGIYDIDR